MDLEARLTSENASLALREFTFAANQFSPELGDTKEFADGVIWLKNTLVVYQAKQRADNSDMTLSKIESWFESKVEGKAAGQIRNTHHYLGEHATIAIVNARGHTFDIKTEHFDVIHNVVLFGSNSGFPEEWSPRKHHVSTSSGKELFIHFVEFESYLRLWETLLTPAELFEYLAFRERYLSHSDAVSEKPEMWILGRFLMSPEIDDSNLDEADCSVAVDNLRRDADRLSVRKFLDGMGERIAHVSHSKGSGEQSVDETTYYSVLIPFALLDRTGLMALSERFSRAISHAARDELRFFRFEIPVRSCGYLIAALPRMLMWERKKFLLRYMQLNKYERRLSECAGVSVCFAARHVEIDWGFLDEPWQQNDDLDVLLDVLEKEGSPFPAVRSEKVVRYDTSI